MLLGQWNGFDKGTTMSISHCQGKLSQVCWRGEVPVLGSVERMWDLMGATDVLVTKARLETICEEVNAELPILIFDALPRQEAGIAEYAVSHGAGLLPQALVAAVRELLSDPGRLADMRAGAQELARPQAALDIAQLILSRTRITHHGSQK